MLRWFSWSTFWPASDCPGTSSPKYRRCGLPPVCGSTAKSKLTSSSACERIGPQECPTHGHSHPLHGAVCSDHGHLFAPFCHDPVSRDARHLEKPSSPHPVLAGLHASPLPRAENLGRTLPLDPGGHHRVAFPPLGEGELLACASAAGVVGPRSAQHLAAVRAWGHPSCG